MRQIPRHQVLARLRHENPWWQAPHAIPEPFASWRPRAYLDLFVGLVERVGIRRALVLMGPRRVGKTVLLHHLIAAQLRNGESPVSLLYASVDHPLYNGLDLEDVLGIYQEAVGLDPRTTPCTVIFDEIQYLKDWERYLKAIVDRYPKVRCIASGSAAAALRLKSLESGAGRFSEFLLPPLTFYEFMDLLGHRNLIDLDPETKTLPTTQDLAQVNALFLAYINHGGYPEAALSPAIQEDPGRYIKGDIIDKVLLRDLPSLYGIQDIQELNYLFTTLAFNTAGEVSFEALSKTSGVAKNTLRRYLEYLEAAFLLRRVERVDRRARRFQRATNFKIYLTNPSIRSALFAPVDADDEAIGSMVETAIFAQWFHRSDPLWYARWKQGEVDLVRLDPAQRVTWALEVKWSDRGARSPGQLGGLLDFCHTHGLESAWVTSREISGSRSEQGVELRFLPASLYCYAVGYWGLREPRTHFDAIPSPGSPAAS